MANKLTYRLLVPRDCDPSLVSNERLMDYLRYRCSQAGKLERFLEMEDERLFNLECREALINTYAIL